MAWTCKTWPRRSRDICKLSIEWNLEGSFRNAHRNVDVKMLDEKEQQRLKALWDKKRLPKKEVVTEKFIGEGNRGYGVNLAIVTT